MSTSEADEYYEGTRTKPIIRQLTVEDREINYVVVHTGKPALIVFLHGAPGSWSAFADYLRSPALTDQADLMSIDRPGYGYSDFGRAEVSLGRQAYLISEVLKVHPHERVILVGHSLGGPVAARMAMDYPELISGLVLVAPSIDPEMEKREWYRPLGRSLLGKLILPKSLWVTNEEIYFLRKELETMLSGWAKIEAQTIVIQGDQDNLVPKENADFALRVMNEEVLTVRVAEGVNHFIPWNRSDLIYDALEELLDNANVGGNSAK